MSTDDKPLKYDAEAQGLVSGENTGQQAPKATTSQLLMSAFCNILVSGAIGGYAIYVGSKYKSNTTPQCVTDVNWLNVFGYLTVILTVVSLLIIPLNTAHRYTVANNMGIGITGLLSLATIFLLGWSIYGCVVFFKLPICPQAEIHLFGKILAWCLVISGPFICCAAMCMMGVTFGNFLKKAFSNDFN